MRKIFLFTLIATLFISSLAKAEPAKENPLLKMTATELSKKSSKTKKKLFTESMVAIIDDVRTEIEGNKEKVAALSKKSSHTSEERKFLNEQFDKYRVKRNNYKELLDKMLVPPSSLILAQASLESGWGRSKLSAKSNNLFGMKSFNSSEPRVKMSNGRYSAYYRSYDTMRDSVFDYVVNLSRHNAYKKLRTGIKNGESSISLTKYLSAYCDDPSYGRDLVTMIKNNNFTKHDI